MSEPESIGIREVRQHASRYVAMAKAGQRVPVTERGTLVAYLVPAEEPSCPFERLVAAGRVRQATIPRNRRPHATSATRTRRAIAVRGPAGDARLGFLELVRDEAESRSMGQYVGDREDLVSSALLIVEARRGMLPTNDRRAGSSNSVIARTGT